MEWHRPALRTPPSHGDWRRSRSAPRVRRAGLRRDGVCCRACRDPWDSALFVCSPRGLATVALSMLARPQSIWSCSRRRLSSAKCSRSQTPSACQSRKRRQHVIPLPKPNSFGRSSHGIPVCKTNRMPFSAARSPARGWPPLAEGFTTGSSGCRTFHNALLIFFQTMSPKTSMDRCQMTWLFRNYKTSLAVEGLPRRIDQHRPYD